MYVDEMKLAGKKQNINPTWKIAMKDVDLGEPTSFLDHVNIGCTQGYCRQLQKYDLLQDFSRSCGTSFQCVERHCELANKTTQQLHKSQHHPLTTIKSKKKKWDLLENCLLFAHNLFCNVCIWLVLVDLIFYGL